MSTTNLATTDDQAEFDTDMAHLRSLADVMYEQPHLLGNAPAATIEQRMRASMSGAAIRAVYGEWK